MRRTTAAIVALIVIQSGFVFGQSDRKPHVSWTLDSCATCHAPSETAQLTPRLARPCQELCLTCHKLLKNHHPVGVAIPAPVQPPLLLTKKGTNTCTTCHDVTRARVESVPWVSQSFVQKLVQRSIEHKTFFLVMRNDRGQLCRNCH